MTTWRVFFIYLIEGAHSTLTLPKKRFLLNSNFLGSRVPSVYGFISQRGGG